MIYLYFNRLLTEEKTTLLLCSMKLSLINLYEDETVQSDGRYFPPYLQDHLQFRECETFSVNNVLEGLLW